MLSVTNDCVLSWLQCADMLQVWCTEVLRASSRCDELLVGTESADLISGVNKAHQSISDLVSNEITQFKTVISTELSRLAADERGDRELGACSDVKVLTHCVRAFVDAQLRFFQSAAGQLAQLPGCHDNTEQVNDCTTANQQVTSTMISHQQVDKSVKDVTLNCLAKPPGLCVSPQTTTEKRQHCAGRSATENDLNYVINMLSQSSRSVATSLSDSLSHANVSQSLYSSPSMYSNRHVYSADKCMPVDQQHATNIEYLTAKNNPSSPWTNCHPPAVNTSSLDQFAAALRDPSSSCLEMPVGSWHQLHTGAPPPKVFVEESWPSLGTEIWTQNTGWSPGKTTCDSAGGGGGVVDSCSSDESSNGDVNLNHSISSSSHLRRRHSSGERGSFYDSAENTPVNAPLNVTVHQSEMRSIWGMTLPQPGLKDKSALTVEGHRPLFMQRSDPLAQRPFSCWQTGAGSGPADNTSLYGAAGSISALPQHHLTSDRTF